MSAEKTDTGDGVTIRRHIRTAERLVALSRSLREIGADAERWRRYDPVRAQTIARKLASAANLLLEAAVLAQDLRTKPNRGEQTE